MKDWKKRGIGLCIGGATMLLLGLPMHISAQNELKEPRIIVEDSDGYWTQDSDLNIFPERDGNKYLTDSDWGEYVFTIHNDAHFTSAYELLMSETNDEKIPIEYQLENSEGKNILGTEDEWVTLSEPQKYKNDMEINQKDTLTLKWRWSQNGISDNEVADGSVYTIHLHIDGYQTGQDIDEEEPVYPDVPETPETEHPDEIQPEIPDHGNDIIDSEQGVDGNIQDNEIVSNSGDTNNNSITSNTHISSGNTSGTDENQLDGNSETDKKDEDTSIKQEIDEQLESAEKKSLLGFIIIVSSVFVGGAGAVTLFIKKGINKK